jgi:Tol biopolymer transport system component
MGAGHASRAALVLASLSAILALLVSPAEAAFPGRNGRIAFVRTSAEVHSHVWTMAADGTSQRVLTQRRGEAPAWSPHGTRIAFSWIYDRNDDGSITIVDADGTDGHTIIRGPNNEHPSWSPDGRQIAHTGTFDYLRFAIVDSSSGHIVSLADMPRPKKSGFEPAWSPGHRIAFEAIFYRNFSSEVFTMDVDGDHVRRLTHNSASEDDLDWSPDGSQIVFVRDRSRTEAKHVSDIVVMGSHGHDHTVLTDTHRAEGSAAFSPNGKKIVFDRCCYGDSETSEIFVMRAAGTHVVRLTNNEVDDTAPDWQPIPRG